MLCNCTSGVSVQVVEMLLPQGQLSFYCSQPYLKLMIWNNVFKHKWTKKRVSLLFLCFSVSVGAFTCVYVYSNELATAFVHTLGPGRCEVSKAII